MSAGVISWIALGVSGFNVAFAVFVEIAKRWSWGEPKHGVTYADGHGPDGIRSVSW